MPSSLHRKDAGIGDMTEQINGIRTGELDIYKVREEYRKRYTETDVAINGAAVSFYDELEKSQPDTKLPLAGLPVSVKETFGIAGHEITAGSLRMVPSLKKRDSEVVKRIKLAGGFIAARGNIPEFAMSGETENLRFGRTCSPLNTAHIAGGSSGGDAALVGSGAVAIGFGSDILGSLRIPAHACGISGFRPDSAKVPKKGTFPVVRGFTDSMLSIGPLAASVRDALLGYNLITDEPLDQNDIDKAAVKLWLPENFLMKTDKLMAHALSESAELLKEKTVKVETPDFSEVKQLFAATVGLIIHDLEGPMRQLLTTAEGRKFRVLPELFRQLTGRPTVYRGLFSMLAAMPVVRPSEKKAGRMQAFVEQCRGQIYERLGTDTVILLPTVAEMPPKHKQFNRMANRPGTNLTMTPTTYCNILNLPAISIPAFRFRDPKTGLVPGMMLACAPGGEAALFKAAFELEKPVS